MRKKLFVLIFLLLFVLAGCQKADTDVSQPDTSAPSLVVVETQEDESSTTQTSTAEESKETESSTSHEETETASDSTASKPATTETSSPQLNIETSDKKHADENSETTETSKGTVSSVTEPKETTVTETEAPPPSTEVAKPPEVIRPNADEVSSLVAMYVNQYRGTPATILLGLGDVANYRARQLVTNFAHTDGIDACNALQYGEFVDMTLYGMSESDSYYQGYNREAIAMGNWGGTADEIAQSIAIGFKNSSSHWKYLGSAEYSYMAVGCTYDEATSMWYCCICVSSKNYGG